MYNNVNISSVKINIRLMTKIKIKAMEKRKLRTDTAVAILDNRNIV